MNWWTQTVQFSSVEITLANSTDIKLTKTRENSHNCLSFRLAQSRVCHFPTLITHKRSQFSKFYLFCLFYRRSYKTAMRTPQTQNTNWRPRRKMRISTSFSSNTTLARVYFFIFSNVCTWERDFCWSSSHEWIFCIFKSPTCLVNFEIWSVFLSEKLTSAKSQTCGFDDHRK